MNILSIPQNPWTAFAVLCLTAYSVGVALPSVNASDELPEFDCVIEPSEIVDIGSATAGVLESVTYDRGDSVRKNQIVARLESGTEQAAAELARVRSTFDTGIELRRRSAEFFNRNQERSRSLTKKSAISKQQLDQLDTEALVAELQVRQEEDNKQLANLEYRRAREALRRRSIKSPIDGVVVERFRSVGEYVEDTAIMRVAQLDPLYIETIVPVSYMGKIKSGMQAKVTPVVPGEEPEYAVVTRIDRVADAASGTFGVRLEMNNPDENIATGVRCLLDFTGKQVSVNNDQPKNKVAAAPVAQQSPNNHAASNASLSQCFEAGPIAQRSVASDLIDLLSSNGGMATIREVSGQHPGQYFVLTNKTSGRDAVRALLSDLQEKGVNDMHLLTKGIHKGKVSLGLFKSIESANARARELEHAGVTTHVSLRSPSSLWLEISGGKTPMDTNSVRRLLAANAPENIEGIPCSSLQTYVK